MECHALGRARDLVMDCNLNGISPKTDQYPPKGCRSRDYYQFASIRGAGNCPLIVRTFLRYPSGAFLCLLIVKS